MKRSVFFDVPLVDPVQGVEIAYLAPDAGGKVGGVEAGDHANARAPRHQYLPALFEPHSKRRDQAKTGYHAAITVVFHPSAAPLLARCKIFPLFPL
jgi:hypothetical protein